MRKVHTWRKITQLTALDCSHNHQQELTFYHFPIRVGKLPFLQCRPFMNIEVIPDVDTHGQAWASRRLNRSGPTWLDALLLTLSWAVKTDTKRYLSHRSLLDAWVTSDLCACLHLESGSGNEKLKAPRSAVNNQRLFESAGNWKVFVSAVEFPDWRILWLRIRNGCDPLGHHFPWRWMSPCTF